jgi:hypothetical protein
MGSRVLYGGLIDLDDELEECVHDPDRAMGPEARRIESEDRKKESERWEMATQQAKTKTEGYREQREREQGCKVSAGGDSSKPRRLRKD